MIQTENDYDKEVFNGDIGQIVKIKPVEREVTIRFDQREVVYRAVEKVVQRAAPPGRLRSSDF